jgi:serine protease
MQKGNASNAQANAGHHFILLVQPGTLKTVMSRDASATNGSYPFSFTGVSPGDYLLIAGTDSDGDTFICDPGEACGAFPTTETIVPITVNADRNGLQFVTGFKAEVGAAAAGAGEAAPGRGYATELGRSPLDP